MNLTGQTVLVVGGTSGIGLATAEAARAAGAEVVITGLDPRSTTEVAKQIKARASFSFDIADEAAVNSALSTIDTVDHVYIAAGSTMLSDVAADPLGPQVAAILTRLQGSVHVVRAILPKLSARGSVTFTGGVSTDRPVKGAWVSGIGTAAAEQLARVLAVELTPRRFNAVSPGWTDTPMWDKILGENKTDVLNDVASRLLVGHIAAPEHVASAILLLMTNPSITGEVIHIDGGGRFV